MADNGLVYDYLFDLCPAHWDIVPFPDAVDFEEGPGILARDFRDAGVPLLRLRNITSSTVDLDGCNYLDSAMVDRKWSHFRLRRGDLVLSTSGTLGRVSTVDEDSEGAIPYTGIIRMRPATDHVHAGFIKYFMLSPLFRIQAEAMASGSVLRHYGPSHLRQMTFPVPPLNEQRAIADILGSLDDKIELHRQMNQTLEAMARAIFKSWFIDFDPVRAKVDGNPPPGLDPATAALFPDAFQDSPLGPIPQGWRVSTVGDEFQLTMGQSPPGSTYNETGDGIPFFQGRADFGFRYPSNRVYCTAPTRFADKHDTLVSVRAPVGDINMAAERCAVGRGVAAVRHKSGSRSYTYYGMHTLGDHFATYEGEGTVFGSINKKGFTSIAWLAPDDDVIDAFEQAVHPIDEQVEVNTRQSMTLTTIRDALLPKLLSGALRVDEAMNQTMEVTP